MEKIVDVKYTNVFIRIVSCMSLIVGIFLVVFFIVGSRYGSKNIDIIYMLGLFILFSIVYSIRCFNRIKYYISKIYIDHLNSKIYIEYYKWTKLYKIEANKNQIKVHLLIFKSAVLTLYFENRILLKQLDPMIGMVTEWKSKLVKETYNKLIEALKKTGEDT